MSHFLFEFVQRASTAIIIWDGGVLGLYLLYIICKIFALIRHGLCLEF